jgi:hypothetical protein
LDGIKFKKIFADCVFPEKVDEGKRNSILSLSLSPFLHQSRQFKVARSYIFKPKIPIWVIFGGPWN